jgi:hypothetical protein
VRKDVNLWGLDKVVPGLALGALVKVVPTLITHECRVLCQETLKRKILLWIS